MPGGHDEGHVLLTVGQLVEPVTGRRWDPPTTTREVAARSARHERRGLRPGDRVFLHSGNRLEFLAELLAVWRLGGTRLRRIAGVWTFFALISIWADASAATFGQRVDFFLSLFGLR